MTHPERIVPDETEPGIVALHLKRYEFARPFCAGKDVLDAGCGVGYGTAYVAETARRVVGVDVDADAIEYARTRYARDNVEFVAGDLTELGFEDESFDAVCAFEVIEHLDDVDAFLSSAARALRAGGVFVASTPRVDETRSEPENPYHRIEFSARDFESTLERHFRVVELYGQHRVQTRRHRALQRADVLGLRKRLPFLRGASRLVSGTASMETVSTDEIAISPELVDRATELVAVCRP